MFALHNPVIQVIIKMSISLQEMMIIEYCGILHYVQAVVHIAAEVFSEY